MKIQPQTHLRRGALVEWLVKDFGFTEWKVRDLIAAGAIPAKHIPHQRRERASKGQQPSRPTKSPRSSQAKKKAGEQTNKLIPGRAYFVAGDVAKALGIPL